MICIKCNEDKPHYAKGLCRRCYIVTLITNKWDNNPGLKEKTFETIHKVKVCNIIKKHHEDMKDDSERLSTEFIQNIIGIKCKEE